MVKIIIADDQDILCESLKLIIEQDSDLKVVGYAGNGLEAFKLCDELLPDIVLMDIVMPVCNGVVGTGLIKTKHQSIKVMILTTFADDENIAKALKNGADGYVLKDIKPESLIKAIKSIMEGMPVIHPKAFTSIVKQINPNEVTNTKDIIPDFCLTDKEIKIIQLIVDGKSNKEIAIYLNFSEGSVKNIITGILNKLKLKDRTQLAVYAVKKNLI